MRPLTIIQLKRYAQERRLQTAAVLAVLVHLVLAIAIGWQFNWLSTPADEERLLVMTLEKTPVQGINQVESVADTVNDAKIGVNRSSSGDDAPAPPPLATTYIESVDSSTPDMPETPPANPVASVVAEEIQPAAVEELATDEPMAAEPALVGQHSEPSPDAIAVITQAEGELDAPVTANDEFTEAVEVMPLSEPQKNMLQQKIRQWSTHIEHSDFPSEPLRWEHEGQEYSATFKRIPAGGEMDLENVLVDVITDQNGTQLSTQMRLKKLAFSNFAQFVHRWDRDLQFHDDVIDGRFHSNSRIHLEVGPDAQPVFHGRVTTASHSVDINRSGRLDGTDSVFLDGLETGIRKIEMPLSNLLFADTPQPGRGATYFFDQDTRIIFAANGQFFWHHINGDSILHAQPIGDLPIRIQAEKGVSLYVSGEVAGKVLVFSPKRIVIEGDLVYAGHPGSSDGDSFLGLVSARNIDIARSRVTGPGDLKIDGAIYAQRKFTVRGRTANNEGTLHIFGSLSAASLTATEPRYATKIVFDPRLEQNRPPGFPVTNRFELALADEYWTSPGDADEQPRVGDLTQ